MRHRQASTLALDRIVGRARAVGAKVLLVGDWAQMSAVQAGGAFAMLVRDRPDPAELTADPPVHPPVGTSRQRAASWPATRP